ncbi:hypothetical protein AB0M80_29605 [Amycolatopsis sp. NPDC051045]|uniref:hypothetical protein n=1 Tax=Amycolatopsis sp. NPDC051045 TaxID=3156922 RepID=UPI00344967B3
MPIVLVGATAAGPVALLSGFGDALPYLAVNLAKAPRELPMDHLPKTAQAAARIDTMSATQSKKLD